MTTIQPPARVLTVFRTDTNAATAARWASELARKLSVPLAVIDAVTNPSSEHDVDDERRFEAEVSRKLDSWADEHGIETGDHIVTEEDEHAFLVSHTQPNDVVIMPSHRHEGFSSWAIGSPFHALAHEITCPLIMVPPGSEARQGAPIVVGLDDSDANEAVVAWAITMASSLDRLVDAVYARDPMYDTFDSAGDKGPAERRARLAAEHDGVAIDERPCDPAVVLRDRAHESSAFLTVIGTRDHHSLGGLLLGRVVDHLMHEPPGPLAIVAHGGPE